MSELPRLLLHPDFGDGVDDVAELTLSVDRLLQHLTALGAETARDALRAAGFRPVLATDCDGTLWKHDIGEAMFELALRERLLLEVALPGLSALLSRFGLPLHDDANRCALELQRAYQSGELFERGAAQDLSQGEVRAEYYGANTWCFAGHTIDTVRGWTRELFEGPIGFRGKIFDGVRRLLDRARALGLRPLAVSASCQWMVEVGAAQLDIPPQQVAGIRTALRGDILTAELQTPITYGPGKVAAVRALCGGLPAVAMGDSVDATDRELLQSALWRIAVEPSPSRVGYVLTRGAENWRFLDFEHTEDGEAADSFPPQ